MSEILRLTNLLFIGVMSLAPQSYAGEGEGHSHAPGGDLKTIGVVIAVLVVGGLAINFWSKKKK
ncbi:MAG: hypothetical protein ACLGG7_07150 [Bacteriovoracia bacterium]